MLSTDEQVKRLQKVDELVQQAEKTLQKIRAQHERYRQRKFEMAPQQEQEEDEKQEDESNNTFSVQESWVIKEKPKAPMISIKSLYLGDVNSSTSSISAPSKDLNTISEGSEESGEPKIIDVGGADETPKLSETTKKDVDVETVMTPQRDESISVKSEEFEERPGSVKEMRDACTSPNNEDDDDDNDERKMSKSGNISSIRFLVGQDQ